MSRKRGHVQYNGWRIDYGFVVKVRNIAYDKEPLQQAVSQETTIWDTHKGIDSGVGASELLQKGH